MQFAAACPELAQQPSIDDMMPVHVFASDLLGRRTRSFGRGGRRGARLTLGLPFGGMLGVWRHAKRIERVRDTRWTIGKVLEVFDAVADERKVGDCSRSWNEASCRQSRGWT